MSIETWFAVLGLYLLGVAGAWLCFRHLTTAPLEGLVVMALLWPVFFGVAVVAVVVGGLGSLARWRGWEP
jgi:hypothetical protein